ncbi:HEAT repeat domain-containing protein [Brooklawnia propionicigenes]|uniref:HEAT repeat domain-containing protein n=1 Tax=Brooklawnia propionicigenes TaxID=3041175 RepID=A0AAN0K7E6_9ACTN|nr:HEAT repeat domain-containing protein [Brooklawnia sp. SH051]BEH02822.1 HEAT repeat domain-containing protein [Brooklawnia sp. SH051]
MTSTDYRTTRLDSALQSPDASLRLRAALAAGSDPMPADVPVLIAHCGTELDFFVRDMLTWALTCHPADRTVPLLLTELGSPNPQACAQALHTLSKIGDARAWPQITDGLLGAPDDEVARAAWRAAVRLVPAGQRANLARRLAGQLGRGGRDVQLSLSRAFVALGAAAEDVLAEAALRGSPVARLHAAATQRLVSDPDSGFDAALAEAKRVLALGS